MEKRSKYNNTRTEYQGRVFDSKKEAEWAAHLDMMRKAVNPKQRVINIGYQRRMPIVVNGVKICTYVADFEVTFADGRTEVWDVKGFKTQTYILKRKLIKACYGIDIIEV